MLKKGVFISSYFTAKKLALLLICTLVFSSFFAYSITKKSFTEISEKKLSVENLNQNILSNTLVDSSVGGIIYRSRNSCRGTDLTIFTLVGNVGNVLRWESSPSNLNPVWTTIANTTNELTISNFSTTTYYRAVVQNGSFPIAFSSINFTNANPTPANGNVYTPPPGIACGGTNSFVFTLVAFTGTVLRWESSPSPGFSSPTVIPNTANLTQITVTNLTTTTYYRAITSTGNCSEISSTNDGKEILPPSVGGTIASSDTVCSTTNSTLLTLSGQSGTILRWESSTDINFSTINTITNSTTTFTATNISSTTYYRAVVKRGTCPEAYSSTAVISVNTNPLAGATISGGGTYCTSAASVPLSISGHTGTIVSWQFADDSTFTTNATTINTSNNPLNIGRPFPFVRYYRVLVNVPGCGSIFSGFVKLIVVDQTVAGTTAGSTTFCSSTNSHTITLSGNVGTVLRWESSPNSNFIPLSTINNTTTSLALTNINTTTHYRAVVRNDSCDVKNSTTATVTILTNPDAGILTGSDTICNTNNINSTTIVLNSFVGTITKWQSSNNSTFTSNVVDIVHTNDSLLVTNITSTNYYRVIVSNGTCPADTSNVVVIMLNPVSNGGNVTGNNPFNPNVIVCTGTNTSTLILSSHVGTILKWQSSPNPDFTSPVTDIINTTSSYIATNLTTTTYYRAIVKSGICEADTSGIRVITVNPISDAGLLGSDTVCIGTNSTTQRLINYIGSIVKWESSTVSNFSSGVSTIANTSDSLVVTNLSTTTFYRVIIKSGVCSADTSNIGNITVNVASVGGTLTGGGHYCPTVTFPVLVLSGQVGSIVHWEQSTLADFSSNVTVINFTGTNYSTTILTPNTFYYRAVIKSGECAVAYSTIDTITIDSASVAGTIAGSANVCSGTNSTTLTLTGYTGSVVKWQSSTSATFSNAITDIVNTTNTYIASNVSTPTYYRAVLKSGTCTSVNSSIASILVTDPTVGGTINGPLGFCSFINTSTLILTNYVGTIIEWQSSTTADFSGTVISIPNTANLDTITITNLSVTTYYRALIKNGNCASEFSSIKALSLLGPFPDAGNINGPSSVCFGTNNATLTLTGFVGTIIKWQSSTSSTFSSNVIDIANTTSTLTIVNLSTPMYYRAIVFSGPLACEDTSAIKEINIDTKPIAGFIINSDTVCAGLNSTLLRLTNYIGIILKWESSSTADFTGAITNINNTTDSLLVLNLTTTTYFRAIVKNGVCDADTSTIGFIRVDQNTVAGDIVNSDTVCAGLNSTLLRLTNFVGSILQWESSSTADFTGAITNINNTADSLLVLNLTTTTYFRAIVKNGVCDADTSTIGFIRVDQNTVVGDIVNSDTVCAGSNSTLLRLTNYIGIILKWESSTTANFSGTVTNINNTTDSLFVLNLTSTSYYRAIVKSGVCAADTSTVASIVVFSNSISNTITSPTPDSFFVSGNPGTILGSLANADTSLITYIWQSSTLSDSTGFTTITGASTIHFNPDTILQTTWYRRIAIHIYCGSTDTSNIVKLVVFTNGTIYVASIGSSLSATKPIAISPGVYHVDYTITIKNYGNLDLENIRIIEKLDTVFPSPSAFSILSISNSNGLVVNANFDGVNNVELLDPTQSVLLVSELKTIRIKVQVTTNLPNATFINQVYAFANAVNTSISALDTSVDGNNPDPDNNEIPDEQSPTIIEIAVFVPSGFSPNGDNKNDEFVIVGLENYPNNKLEIYNRWGNLVFQQAPYDNKWKGSVKNSDAVVFGDGLLPSGTYFYLLDFGVPGVKQLTGYIVIRK